MTLAARVIGVGLVGPGLAGWASARDVLAGRAPFDPRPTVIPAPEALPPTERRRAGKGVRLALAAGGEAAAASGKPASEYAAIFASSGGDGDNVHAICEQLATDDRLISPTRFHNSVHNAPAGYWGIATGAMHASDSLAAYDASFGAGLLEALGRLAASPERPVLLIAYDAPYPEPLHATRPLPDSFGVALALAGPGEPGGQAIRMQITQGSPSTMADERLESLRRQIPAARSLPLLQALAVGSPAAVTLESLEGLALEVAVGA